MKHKRFSDEQVIGVLKEHEAGAKVDDICRRHAIMACPRLVVRVKSNALLGGLRRLASPVKRVRVA